MQALEGNRRKNISESWTIAELMLHRFFVSHALAAAAQDTVSACYAGSYVY